MDAVNETIDRTRIEQGSMRREDEGCDAKLMQRRCFGAMLLATLWLDRMGRKKNGPGGGSHYAGQEGQCLLEHRPSDHENLGVIGPKIVFFFCPPVLQPQAPDSKSRDLSAAF